jgi:hypothetical protein
MANLQIYCTTIKYYKVMDHLPNFIFPLGLGSTDFPNYWLDEKKGININSLNKFYAELTGFYWLWKNQLKNLNKNDIIGNCHNRVLWLDKLIDQKQKFTTESLYKNLLSNNNHKLNEYDVIQVQPITFKNKNLLSDFEEVHKTDALKKSVFFLNEELQKPFLSHLNGNILYPHNMFLTKVHFFEEYCSIIFPWLAKCMDYCNEKKICNGYNMRLPAFLAERFTSFWFNLFENRTTLSYARLGKFHLSNNFNKFINTMNLPFSFSQYPSIHKF